MIHLDINPPTIADDAPPFLPFGITVYPLTGNHTSSVSLTIYDPVTKNFVSIPGIPATINADPATVAFAQFNSTFTGAGCYNPETGEDDLNFTISTASTSAVHSIGTAYTYLADITAFLMPDEYIRRLARTFTGSCCDDNVVFAGDKPCTGLSANSCTSACIPEVTAASWSTLPATGYSVLIRVNVVAVRGGAVVTTSSETGHPGAYNNSHSVSYGHPASFRLGPVSQLYTIDITDCSGGFAPGATSGNEESPCDQAGNGTGGFSTTTWTISGASCPGTGSHSAQAVSTGLPIYGGHGPSDYRTDNSYYSSNISGDPIVGLPFGVVSLHTINEQCPLTSAAYRALFNPYVVNT